jgi:aminopeptidase-like protein
VYVSDSFLDELWELGSLLWPLNRSLTGSGFEKSLDYLESFADIEFIRHSIDSNESVFDWTIPPEWEVEEAYIVRPDGVKICNFADNNLHLINYSESFNGRLDLQELIPHLHSDPARPRAIPYVTSYYASNWGFCISHDEKNRLLGGEYEVVIKTRKFRGKIQIAEAIIPGAKSAKEVLLSTYLCHPSMANNELSGPLVCASLIRIQRELKSRRGFRVVFLPETIGSIAYLSTNLKKIVERTIAALVVTCVGDERDFSFLGSRYGNTLADNVAKFVLRRRNLPFTQYSWLERGSDERQYGWPGIDIPVASIMRSKYGKFPEYHSSLDTFGDVVTRAGLSDSITVYNEAVSIMRNDFIPKANTFCEPNLGKRDLYALVSNPGIHDKPFSRKILDVLSYCDGSNLPSDIASLCKMDIREVEEIISIALENNLVNDL